MSADIMKTFTSRVALVTAGASVPRHTVEARRNRQRNAAKTDGEEKKRKTAMRKLDRKIVLITGAMAGSALRPRRSA